MSRKRSAVVERRATAETKGASRRAFRGLALVFALSFVNLTGVLLTAAAIGGVEPWTRWQFVGLFGVVEAAAGLGNVVSPNIWRLPIAELETSHRTATRLAASTLLIPHWGGLARCAAGLVLVGLAGWQEGVGIESLLLVPLVLALAWSTLAVSAVFARAGVAWPELDVLQFVVRWGRREKELAPISIGASLLQFLLSIVTLPAAKLLPPSVLYRPAIAPSVTSFAAAMAAAIVLAVAVYVLWSKRIVLQAPAEQQREAEAHG
jgi:hypothetical protein